MKKFKRLTGAVMALMMVVGLGAPAFADFGIPEAPATHTVNLHKLMYDSDTTAPDIQNTGYELDSITLEAYDRTLYGDVGFTLYELDESTLAEQENGAAVAQALQDAIKDGTTPLPYGAQVWGSEVMVNDEGVATFTNVPGLDQAYVAIESTVPSGVSKVEAPMFFWLPVTNTEGNGYLSDVHLYPKNATKSPELTIVKFVQRNGEEVMALQGATFTLYSGAPGSGTVVEGYEEITNENGEVLVTDLTVGSYYFVEKATNEEGILLDPTVVNADTNRLTFEYTSDATFTFPTGSLLAEGSQVINYEKPEIVKEVVEDEDSIFAIGDTIKYQVTVIVPNNITTYESLSFLDNHSPGVTVDVDSINIEGLTKDTDYTVNTDGVNSSGFNLVFVPDNLQNGVNLTVTYDAIINERAQDATDLENTASLYWDNGEEVGEGEDGGTTQVRTYAHALLKKGAGIFATGVFADALEGAEFIVRRAGEAEGTYEYLKSETDSRTWVTEAEATVFTTGVDGRIVINGLDLGNYEFVEIKAPAGHQLPVGNDAVTKFTVTAYDTEGGYTVTEITNNENPDLPMTGLETGILVGFGLAAISGLGIVVGGKKRKSDSEK